MRLSASKRGERRQRGAKIMWVTSGARMLSGVYLLALAGALTVNAQEFRSGVDMVALAVTVTDGKGQAVTGLCARDFRVFDDGVPQEVALFGSAQVPLDVVLVFDTSSSMVAALPVVKSGALGLLSGLRAGDRAALVEVMGTINVPGALTADLPSIEAAIGRLSASGNTALHDGVYLSLRQFERERRVRPERRHQALVLFSDGVDTASHLGFDEVAALARALDVTIYSITLQEEKGSEGPALAARVRAASWQMRTLTRDTGGLAYFPKRIWELERIYETIARELVNQYTLAYVAPVRGKGQPFRRVSVGLVAPAQGVARTRTGYVVAPALGANASGGSHR
jgi:VWFA-related protein